jgi:hypothetical protein
MRLFRSEEHLKAREDFTERDLRGMIELETLMQMFSGSMFRKRAEPDYASRMGEYLAELVPQLDDLEGAGSHFRMAWYEKMGLKVAQALGL